MMVHIGVVGCGKIAEKHLNAYRKIANIKVTVSDIVDKGKTVANNYGASWCDNPDELLKDSAIDAIDVCVPTPSHRDVILKALNNQKHVFCEKPLACNIDEAIQIKKMTDKAKKVVMVGYLYRFHPAFQFAKDIVEEGIIGKPYYAIFRLGGRGSHKAWKHLRNTGGGACNEMLVHMLDLILWYFGNPRSVSSLYVDTLIKERIINGKKIRPDAEDLIVVKLDMENDLKVLCESDLITPSYMNYLEIHGDNGSIWTSILDFFPTIVYCKEPRGVYDRGHNFFNFSKIDLFERQLRHFVECISDNRPPTLNSIDDSIKVMNLLSVIMKEVI